LAARPCIFAKATRDAFALVPAPRAFRTRARELIHFIEGAKPLGNSAFKEEVSMALEKLTCTPKSLPRSRWIPAAEHATKINPANRGPAERLVRAMRGFAAQPMHIAVLTKKYWGVSGVKLTVGFLDTPPVDLRKRIVLHMNAWGKFGNIAFTESRTDADVRIARAGGADGGYWSYVGTDIHQIAKDQATMNLEGFTMSTPESEFVRVVRHEAGHTLGFPHEHMRDQLVAKIDREKAIKYFMQTQGWSRQEVIAQVLTPLSRSSLRGTAHADPTSIMCYQIPGILTKDGKAILGGKDIDRLDGEFVALIYPKKTKLTRPPKPKLPKKSRRGRR
jgi:hypothetical protein